MENIHEQAAQAAARSMMYQALVAFFCSVFLPLVVAPRREQKIVLQLPQRNEATGRKVHRLFQKRLDLVTVWLFSHGIFASCLFATLWTKSHAGITVIYAISGFPSALLHWAPHALLGEAILAEQELGSPSSEVSSLMSRDEVESFDANLASPTPLPTYTHVKDNPGIVLVGHLCFLRLR
ncbi:11041_t:CDS:2 [Acaulospora colombiana]|uniref:11041_t:CDS:1 n=1 Tax=Acaulospora colombiana TaxID=27376 RepID=A0ACA9MLX2_9GLOM|nr:11041_t:CDS:2 [Acaulospora colombiana]